MHLARLLLVALVATLATTTGAVALAVPAQAGTWAAPKVDPDVDPDDDLDEFENRVLDRINQRRARHGLRRVRVFQSCVDRTSERWAGRLSRTGDFMHRDQRTVLRRCDLSWTGETLVRGAGLTPGVAVRSWMASPSHRAVIMKRRARWAGIGTRVDGEGRVVTVLNFGDPD